MKPLIQKIFHFFGNLAPAWLWVLATAVMSFWALADMAIHLHDDLQEGRQMLISAVADRELCESMNLHKGLGHILNPSLHQSKLQDACSQIYRTPLPVPWKMVIHRAWSRIWITMELMILRLLHIGIWAAFLGISGLILTLWFFRGIIPWNRVWPTTVENVGELRRRAMGPIQSVLPLPRGVQAHHQE